MNQPSLFKWRHFEAEIILLCVRWYVRVRHVTDFRILLQAERTGRRFFGSRASPLAERSRGP
jgi:transposase-like protein